MLFHCSLVTSWSSNNELSHRFIHINLRTRREYLFCCVHSVGLMTCVTECDIRIFIIFFYLVMLYYSTGLPIWPDEGYSPSLVHELR